jgi:hypothetical protein
MQAEDCVSTVQSVADHLNDDQLMEVCFPLTDSRHLTTCGTCRSRYDDLVRCLDEIREDAVQEADALFTSERLAEQRGAILRRLQQVPHSAEIVRFPARSAGVHTEWHSSEPTRRWIAAAAAAGLVAGLLVGRFVDIGSRPTSSTQSGVSATDTRRVAAGPAATMIQPPADEFLVEIEDAVTSRRVVELQALDALTSPELREINLEIP